MIFAVSPSEYVAYTDAIKDVKHGEPRTNIEAINQMHEKLQNAQGSEACISLAKRKYLKNFVRMKLWNGYHPDRPIRLLDTHPEPMISTTTADEKALSRYFELLAQYPKLTRADEGGIFQIYTDRESIERVRKATFERTKSAEASQIGVIMEDRFWIVIRDAGRAPSGFEHTFNRHISKADLNDNPGAAVLAIQSVQDVKMISLQLAYRHATRSWEWEIPRGGSKPGETAEQTARRELREETGYEVKNVVELGVITPDSGLTAAVVPIFLGEVASEGKTDHDKTEAIQGKHLFTIEELKKGLKTGSLVYEQDGIRKEAPLRDPFLNTALLQAYLQGYLEL